MSSNNSNILAAHLPNAELRVLSRAGHAFPLEQPDALPQAIEAVATRAGWP